MSNLESKAREAFTRVKTACPEDARTIGEYVGALKTQNVTALGEGDAYTLKDAEGRTIRATKRYVRLSAENGGLIQPVFNGPFVISAPGYTMLAAASGAVVMNAPTVIVDGVQQQNPYVRRDAEGSIVEVHCRAIAFRYNEHGQPCVSDRTTIFDTATYTLADMVGKAKNTKDAFKLLPAQSKSPAPEGEWACYKVDCAVNLWMRISHDEVLKFLGQVLNRKKKALEFAQTFAQRNALKHLFGIAVVPGQERNKNIDFWDVQVINWSPSDGGLVRFDTARYAASAQVIDALTAGRPVELPEASNAVVISRGTEELHGSDLEHETDPHENPDRYGNASIFDVPTAPKPEPAAPVQPIQQPTQQSYQASQDQWTPQQMAAMNNLEVAKGDFPDEYAAALTALGLSEVHAVLPENAERIMSAISRQLER